MCNNKSGAVYGNFHTGNNENIGNFVGYNQPISSISGICPTCGRCPTCGQYKEITVYPHYPHTITCSSISSIPNCS